ncbi:patatin-like phospholipase family protein [Stenotrophobium rhamnosiphilum]|uniref:Phospholipase n=1 Tax=Stenotrophobium rhamnosiphilum TaxID=2029166 RepID=A0A2T5MKP4_9GAMM|nr:patatin-like phospholipase family protein [Stenotrophobium rhamnosiphilum]PTU33129.1 phospholipase [Stenotrophobium rhamnosiphilum]
MKRLDRAKKSGAKRALVLGCGGVAGAAWTIPMLDAVQRQLKWDAREADILIGTSAGAVIASLLAAGVSVDQMMASQNGTAEDCIWNHDTDTGGALPPRPALRFPAARLAIQGLRGKVGLLAGVSGLLPEGRCDMTPFMRVIDSVVPEGEWAPHPACWIVTADAKSGERVAFGRDDAPEAPMNLAVCASYGVPGWCPPIQIGDRSFMDGGILSPTSADLLLGSDVTEAIVIAPMASTQFDHPTSMATKIERYMRRYMTRIVDREIVQLRDAGIRVVRLEPGPADLKAFGSNMMDPRRRLRVFETALRTAPETLRAVA